MKKRLLAILLAVTMLIPQLPVSALAETEDQSMDIGPIDVVTADEENETFRNPFTDVPEDSWYYDAVRYAFLNGIFSGTSATTFDPDGKLTRGMFVTVLARMAGVDASAYAGHTDFRDVDPDAWYAPFVAWAAKYGIAAGIGDGKFDPDGLVTREQMAVFFVRYFETFNVSYDTGANITTVPADLDAISPWARESVLKLWRTGLLSGDGVSFNPQATASRAEAASLSMRTDKAVETWYKEPGVPSDRVRIDPDSGASSEPTDKPKINAEEIIPSSDNITVKTYYKVTLVTNDSSKEQLFEQGTLLSTLPAPARTDGKVFLGWYYDADLLHPVAANDRLTRDITLYANLADGLEMPEGGTPNFVTALDQTPDFSIAVKSDSMPQAGKDFIFRNITAPEKTPEDGGAADDLGIETVKVENMGGGVWKISSASGGFTPGHTYQIELISDNVVFDDSADVFGNMKEGNPMYDAANFRFFNFTIEQNGVLNLKLKDDIKFIPAEDVLEADRENLFGYAGLYLAATDSEGNTVYTANNGSGTFTYLGNEAITVGDTVAVYEGTHPAQRQPEKGTGEGQKTDNGNVSYLKITWQEGNTYTYVVADPLDVLFVPDVLPIDVDEGDGTAGWTIGGTSVTIDNAKLKNWISQYEALIDKTDTTVDVGDFLVFYTGELGQADATQLAYGEILEITADDTHTYITYQVVNESAVLSSMDMYDEKELSESELEQIIEQNQDEIEQLIVTQLEESNFFEEAGEYLAAVTLETEEVREAFGEGLTLSDVVITYADGTPVAGDELKLMGNIKNDLDGKRPRFSAKVSTKLVHFSGRAGIRAEVSVNYTFRIQKKDADQVLEVSLTAFFEQEVMIGIGVSGSIVWKKILFLAYPSDYRISGHLDLGTYTGIGITATVKLQDADEPWGIPWPQPVSNAANAAKIFNLSQSIRDMITKMENIVPGDETTASGGLAEKYERFMDDANKDWVDLITADLLTKNGAADPLHIVAYGLDIDFVVSANLHVALGMTYQYEKSKRHSFSLQLFSRKASSSTIDLGINGYQFDLYVMGHIGLRAGIRTKITIGLLSTRVAGIGLQFEIGFYARLWGYFYYYVENWKVGGTWQNKKGYSGALLVEIGTYLDVKFIAEALNGQYRFDPSLITAEYPLWSAGQRENVYDFAYQEDPVVDILNVTQFTIPSSYYDMLWMDLKTGKIREGSKLKTRNYDSRMGNVLSTKPQHEQYFYVEISNPNFRYNPVTNLLTIDTSSGAVEQTGTMKITWKGAPLSISSEPLSRTITLNWSNDKDAATIEFEANGGSPVPMLRLLTGTPLSGKMPEDPKKLGYIFDGWYLDEELTQPFTDTTMPAGDTKLYAKWEPDWANYTVEHYKQTLSGRFELEETETFTDLAGYQTNAAAKPYEGFTAGPFSQMAISNDDSTVVAIYYSRNSYTLTFDYGDDKVVKATIPYETEIVKPPYPTRPGYIFDGWDVTIPDTMPAHDLTITAQWEDDALGVPYTVKHVRQTLEGTYPAAGELVELEAMRGVPGKSTFVNPKTYTGFTVQQPIVQKKVAENGSTVVEIRYERNRHNITWNLNGGNPLTGDYSQGKIQYGEPIRLPDPPTRKTYRFVGWYKDAAFTIPLEENDTMPDQPLTLYALWEYYGASYKVRHYLELKNGEFGLATTTTGTGTIGTLTEEVPLVYVGHTPAPFEQQIIKADHSTVVEIYYYLETIYHFFHLNPDDMITYTYKYSDPTQTPEDPEYPGAVFLGWSGPIPTVAQATINFYARWNKPYTVKHIRQDVNGTYPEDGPLVETEELYGVVEGMTAAQAKTYAGFEALPFQQKWREDVREDVEVEIRYARKSHTVTWSVYGATLTGDYTQGETLYGAPIILPDVPVRDGYVFAGWYKDENMTIPLEANPTMPDAPLTIYGRWEEASE